MRRLGLFMLLLVSACSKQPAPTAAQQPDLPKITQFYADPVVALGEKTNLCYGVENAKNVRLEPEVDRVWPAVSRCLSVSPRQTTTYTLTADDGQGHSATRSLEIRVGGPRPKIIEVTVNKLEVKAGDLVTLCYTARNATSVEAGPGHFAANRTNDRGCFADNPRKTTTYHVSITGTGGQTDSEKVTVRVKP